MKTSGVQEALRILKESVEDSSAGGKRVSKPEPKKVKKAAVKAKKPRKS
ncbi:MAG: hypothetical protein RL414_1267 [Actinomycetota bacterium]|jgi:hypothetical protein